MKQRLREQELMDDPALPADVWEQVHRDLDRVHRVLGNYRAIFSQLEQQAASVVDLGCGTGNLLRRLRRHRSVQGVGVDLRPPSVSAEPGITYVAADATRDHLPPADAAVSLCLIHHLTEDELIALIRNSRRSVRQLILVDLVRHPMPLWLFRLFVKPFLHPVTATDGILSIRRSWTPSELRALVQHAVAERPSQWRHAVAPFWIRQMVEIKWL